MKISTLLATLFIAGFRTLKNVSQIFQMLEWLQFSDRNILHMLYMLHFSEHNFLICFNGYNVVKRNFNICSTGHILSIAFAIPHAVHAFMWCCHKSHFLTRKNTFWNHSPLWKLHNFRMDLLRLFDHLYACDPRTLSALTTFIDGLDWCVVLGSPWGFQQHTKERREWNGIPGWWVTTTQEELHHWYNSSLAKSPWTLNPKP